MPPTLTRLPLSAALSLCGLALFLAPAPAHAQVPAAGATIAIGQEASLPRIDAEGKPVPKRLVALEPEGVSLSDCQQDIRIVFPLQLANFALQATLEAWAGLSGVNCGVQTNRTGVARQCWQLVAGIPLQLTTQPAISVRKIMSGAVSGGVANLDESAGVCGKVDLNTITVQFLYFAPGMTAESAANKDISVRVDTVGPPAPGGVTSLPGNTRINIAFTGVGEGGVNAYTSVRAYCDPNKPTTMTVTTEASTMRVCPDAGADAADADAGPEPVGDCEDVLVEGGTTTSGLNCASPNLTPTDGGPIIPDNAFNAKYFCGEIVGVTGSGITAREVAGSPLVNDQKYAFAIAAVDPFGNVGPLSAVDCETPELTTDFWETYKNGGGGAGGGFCSVDGAGLPVGGVTVAGIFAVAFVGTLRRRRRRVGRGEGNSQ